MYRNERRFPKRERERDEREKAVALTPFNNQTSRNRSSKAYFTLGLTIQPSQCPLIILQQRLQFLETFGIVILSDDKHIGMPNMRPIAPLSMLSPLSSAYCP